MLLHILLVRFMLFHCIFIPTVLDGISCANLMMKVYSVGRQYQ